jgi:Trk K+ transport system NAD-binding subunit
MLLPKGVDIIHPGESVVVFTLPEAIERVQALFSSEK